MAFYFGKTCGVIRFAHEQIQEITYDHLRNNAVEMLRQLILVITYILRKLPQD